MTTPLASMLLYFLAASVFGAVGPFLYKSGSDAAQGGLAVTGLLFAGMYCMGR